MIPSLALGGAERQAVTLAVGLSGQGRRVAVCSFRGGGPLEADLVSAGVPIISLGKRGRLDVISAGRELIRIIRQVRPTAIYSFMTDANVAVAALRPWLPNAAVVWGVRTSDLDLSPYGWAPRASFWASRKLAAVPDLVIANSFAGARHYLDRGYPVRTMRVVPNGIDTERFLPSAELRRAARAEWRIADADTVIGIVARIDPVKGHDLFLRAAAALASSHSVRFVSVGKGEPASVAALARRARELGLADRVSWWPATTRPEAAYNGFDIATSCSWSEGFSNSVAEAMACGCSCVVTDVGDSAEIVGSAGWVVPKGDEQALAEAWATAVEAPRDLVGREARERIVRDFSVARMIGRTTDLLDSLVPGSA